MAEAVAKAPGISGAGVLLTLADTRVTVRLSRDIWNLEPRHVQLARRFGSSRQHGAVPDRAAVQEVQVAIAAKRDAIEVGFWRRPRLHPDGQRQCGRPPWTRIDGLDAGARPGQAIAPRDAHRRVCRARARQRVSRRRSRRAVVSSTSRMHHRTGRSPTARVIAFVSVRGQMGPSGDG